MALIVADTDVLIDYLRGGVGASTKVENELRKGLGTTVVSAFELWAGSIGSKKRERVVGTLLDALRILPLEPAASRRAAEVRVGLSRKGRTIGMADSLIAGICLHAGATLMTRNRKHFAGIDGLELLPCD